jgi:hypothetical protein
VGNRFWFYITPYVLRVPYSYGVVLVFWFWREIVFGTYVLSVQYSCAVVSVFLLWQESLFSTNFLVEFENLLLVFLVLYGSTTIQS